MIYIMRPGYKQVGAEGGGLGHWQGSRRLAANSRSCIRRSVRLTGPGFMNAFRAEENKPIESGMLTRSLERAQRKLETCCCEIRKQVFECDEVMHNQRKAVYAKWHQMLVGRELKSQMIGYGDRIMENIMKAYVNPVPPPWEWGLTCLVDKTKELIYIMKDITPDQLKCLEEEELKDFQQEQLLSPSDIKQDQDEEQRQQLMREAER